MLVKFDIMFFIIINTSVSPENRRRVLVAFTCLRVCILRACTHHITRGKSYKYLLKHRGRRSRDRMIVGFTTTYEISAYHH